MRKEIVAWICYFAIVAIAFFWLTGRIHAEEKTSVYLYCGSREVVEAMVRIEKDKGHDAANDAASDALRSGACFASADELSLYVVLRGMAYRRNGIVFQVVGLSPEKSGEPLLWAVYASRDSAT